jgi:hypothetical protein
MLTMVCSFLERHSVRVNIKSLQPAANKNLVSKRSLTAGRPGVAERLDRVAQDYHYTNLQTTSDTAIAGK